MNEKIRKNEEIQLTIGDFLDSDIKQKLFAAAAEAAAV
jgi:hypothetical protein